MVKLIILYYLNIKSTHGYEIQKFIQTTGFDIWAKIKSGSIYYALSKMEKNGEVELVIEETHGSRVRRIYKITDKGREELKRTIEDELGKQLIPIGTEKFIIPMTFNRLSKESATPIINRHIKELKETLDYWIYWKKIKINDSSPEVDKISFGMTITNIEYAIKWHEALINEYDIYIEDAKKLELMIKNFEFDDINEAKSQDSTLDNEKINELREVILNNPENSKEALEQLINLMSKNK